MMRIACMNGEVIEVARSSLAGSDLRGLALHRAVLERQDMAGVIADHVDFRGAVLALSRLDGARLQAADLANITAERCSFRGAQLQGATLSGALLLGADLTGADLTGAMLDGARLAGASLLGANMTDCSMRSARITDALYDENTQWPDDLDLAASGAVLIGDQTKLFYDSSPKAELFG